MQINVNTNVELIIAKIDNDFNPDTSDWIPRVGAWVIDAMGQMDALRKVRKKVKLNVRNRIAHSHCDIDSPNLIVTDSKGYTINKKKACSSCNSCSSTGEIQKIYDVTPVTVDAVYNPNAADGPNVYAETVNGPGNEHRYNIHNQQVPKCRDYVLAEKNILELSFDTDCVYVETDTVETEYSETYQCDIPVIPNVPLLLEAVVFYCMYKMLTRGYKHPVFNLAASQYGTNPYYEWKKLKDEAKRAVIIDEQGNINITDGNLFQSAFVITMFK